MKSVSEAEILHKMAAWCSLCERCIQDVQKKIKDTDLPYEAQERIIVRLLKEKFIDENRFTRSFVNDKLHFNKWGRVKIAYELKKRNIPSSIRVEVLENINEQVYQTILLSLLKAKMKSARGKDERDVFNKLLRFAVGRGFESTVIIPCLRQLFKGRDYETETNYEENFD